MENFETLNTILGIGMFFTLFSIICALATFENSKDRSLFGIPYGLIGFLGYLAMFIAIRFNETLFYALTTIAIMVIPIFIVKSIRLRKVCEFCVLSWLITIALAYVTFKEVFY